MTEPVLVLIHGWGSDSRTWEPVLEALRELAPVQCIDLPGFGAAPPLADFSLEPVLEAIAPQLPQRCLLVGWSLGAMLAVQLAARLPRQVLGVVSLAANARFVADAAYPAAMAPAVNRQFNRGFAEQPEQTLKLFGGLLAQGDLQERALLKQLRAQMPAPADSNGRHNWGQALELLSSLDNRACLQSLVQPLLHLLAECDALVPLAAAEALRSLNPHHRLQVLPGAAHALHWSQPAAVVAAVRDFYQTLAAPAPDKKRIAQSFGKAAASYDAVAGLQRAVGSRLLEYLPPLAQQRVLDLGCGTGYFTAHLAGRGAGVIALDIAQGMLEFARRQHPDSALWLCGDGEQLPLADACVDLVFSSLAIQWCSHLPQLMAELARVLKPGGRACIATLGPGTLAELKRAWQQVDNYVHVNRFAPQAQLEQAAAQAGLGIAEFTPETRVLYFDRLRDLTHELKALGAHNLNPGQARGLTGRQRLQAFSAAYERERVAQGLPATYEIYYLVLSKPQN